MTSERYQVTKEEEKITVELPEGTNLTRRSMQVVLPKPTDNIIPLSSYITDAKNRWKIHQYEIKALSKDIRWGYNKAEPFVRKVIARLSPKAS